MFFRCNSLKSNNIITQDKIISEILNN